jgi:hypothetical protein
MNGLHDCWYLNERYTSGYSSSFQKVLRKYHKLSWNDDCDMKMDQAYFDAHRDPKLITPSHVLTNKLHILLCELTVRDAFGRSHWDTFLFGAESTYAQKLVNSYNRYMALYAELSKTATTDTSPPADSQGGPP